MRETYWSLFRYLINTKEIGSVITRQEILNYVSFSSVDTVRNMSSKLGYLEQTDKSGIYIVRNHFPTEMTLSQLRNQYDNRGLIFMQKLKRLQELKEKWDSFECHVFDLVTKSQMISITKERQEIILECPMVEKYVHFKEYTYRKNSIIELS